ncbi:MAG: tail fiber domain-containing protein [Sphingobacteriales bacterium]|nr:MAG: tail fiber domain-containing protein [Sphingobacteriales bacterium]
MKSILTTIALCLLLFGSSFAQPLNFNYQGIARNASGAPLSNQNIGLRISILDNADVAVFSESHAATTNAYGLYSLQIGDGTAITGTMSAVAALSRAKIKIEVDPAGGANYTDLGTQQLNSVPFALMTKGVEATSDGGMGLRGTASSSLWWGLYEAGLYRGYIGSYSGKNEDVDFGTGGGNNIGSVHLTVAGTPKFTVDSIGNVGIGTRFPKYRLQVDGITGTFNDNGIRIQNTTANTGWSFYASTSGDLIIGKTGNLGYFNGTTGAYTSSSDARLKTNIQNIETVLPKLKLLEAKRYEFRFNNPDHIQSIGFLAQNVQQLFPELITVNKTNEGNPQVDNQLGMDYAGLSVVAIKAIQEQQAQIETLKAEIAALRAELKSSK